MDELKISAQTTEKLKCLFTIVKGFSDDMRRDFNRKHQIWHKYNNPTFGTGNQIQISSYEWR